MKSVSISGRPAVVCTLFFPRPRLEGVVPTREVLEWWCFRKGDPFQGPRVGSCLTLRKWAVRGDTGAEKAVGCNGKGPPGRRAGGSGNPGGLPCLLVHSLGFYGEGISLLVVSCPSLWCQVPSGWLTCCSAKLWCQQEFWMAEGHMVSPSDLGWILPVGDGLLVPCSSSGLPHLDPLSEMDPLLES